MRTIRNIVLVISLLAILSSCKKDINTIERLSSAKDCTLSVGLDGTLTKVAAQSPDNEKSIKTVQIYVFNSSGDLDVATSVGFATSVNYGNSSAELQSISGRIDNLFVKCSSGVDKRIWAIINDSEDRTFSISSESQLLAQTHELKYSSADKLLMIGKRTQTLEPGSANISIEVKRLVASITLNSIENAFYREDALRIEKVYLYNVPARINFGQNSLSSSLDASYWYNKSVLDTEADKLALTYESIEEGGIIVSPGAANKHTISHTFYSYPNEIKENVISASWSPRATLLVVEASYKITQITAQGEEDTWKKSYYPILIDKGLESNMKYNIDLKIKRPGSDNPNEPVQYGDASATIVVADWGVGYSYNTEI